jgi:KUP system potassium uptake protein
VPSHDNVLGILSLVFWSLMVFVSVKYVTFIMRADNRGEGGIMALMALVVGTTPHGSMSRWWLTSLGMFGAALFYGDSMITPAISVLSAVEGLSVATTVFDPYIVPITIVVIIGLFVVQSKGHGDGGPLFGPIMGLWFTVLALLGCRADRPQPARPARAESGLRRPLLRGQRLPRIPRAGLRRARGDGRRGALRGHGPLRPKPIRLGWFALVLPALILNYFGQGSLLLATRRAVAHPFFRMVPEWALYPMVGLATMATVIASQAVISGAFSLTRQAIQLGYCPRLRSATRRRRRSGRSTCPSPTGRCYLAVVALVLGFKSSSALAAAYGIAVTGTMAIDTVLIGFVMVLLWRWVTDLGKGFHRVIVHYGFMQAPDVPAALELCAPHGLTFDMMSTSFFVSRETVIPSLKRRMAPWRERLFCAMSRNAMSATDFFKIPTNRVVEMGTQVEI